MENKYPAEINNMNCNFILTRLKVKEVN